MLKPIFVFGCLVWCLAAGAQDANTQWKEAVNLERQLKEPEALEKYKAILANNPDNIAAMVKCAELNTCLSVGIKDKNGKKTYLDAAKNYAEMAFAKDTNNADACYAMALVSGKYTEVETERKKMIEEVRQTYLYSKRALQLNPSHARANYILGKWHYEMLNLNWFKQVAVKALYGGLPPADIDSALIYMEKCKALEQYFVPNYLDLAKAYNFNRQPAQAIAVLTVLVKLPNRTSNDMAMKEEGKQLLSELQ